MPELSMGPADDLDIRFTKIGSTLACKGLAMSELPIKRCAIPAASALFYHVGVRHLLSEDFQDGLSYKTSHSIRSIVKMIN